MRTSVLLLSWLCAGLLARQSRAFAVHQGCYETVEADARAFPFKAAAANDMTIEACRQLARTRYVGSFALENGRECWLDPLDSSLAQLTRFGAGDACTTPCAGDTRIVCGGQQQASVYLENDATPEVIPPNDYTPAGCYKDDAAARRLTLLWVANNSMSLDLCASIAFREQWLVFGVEGAACYGGQAIESAKALGVSTACTTPCPGDATKTCGGTLALNLYTLPKAPWLEVDSSGPNLLTGSSCGGEAASSEACRAGAPTGSAAGAAGASKVLTGLAVGVAAVLLL